jgi:membrane protein
VKKKKTGRVSPVLKTAAGRFIQHGCFGEARSLSFVTLLSVVPFLTVILVLFSRLPFYSLLKERLLYTVSLNFLPEKSTAITEYLDSILIAGKSVGVIGMLFCIVIAFSLVFSFSRTVNTIWETKGSAHLLESFFKFLVIVIAVPSLILVTFMLQNYISIMGLVGQLLGFMLVGNGFDPPHVGHGFTTVFSLVLNWGLLSLVYGFIPHIKVKPKYCIFSGVCAGTLWWVMRLGLNLYIRYIPQMNLLYGSLVFIPIFLIWIYGSWSIVLFGVELNYSLHFYTDSIPFGVKMPLSGAGMQPK